MDVTRTILLLGALSLADVCAASPSSGEIQTNCDITGPDIKTMKTESPEVCATACQAELSCQGWSFISGWNKCFLKSKIASKTDVRMFAGRVDRSSDPAAISLSGWQKDDSGKDFRRIAPVKKSDECADACVKDAKCLAFVFIEGYQVCWLKKTVGKFTDKVFSCGRRK